MDPKARFRAWGLLLPVFSWLATPAVQAGDCDVIDSVRLKARSIITSYPGPGQDWYGLEVQAALANNVRPDLQGPTAPIDASDRPHYCGAFNWWAKKLYVATEGRYRIQRVHFWEIDADEDRGDWTTSESPFHVYWQLGHAFDNAFWPKAGAIVTMSDFPIMCTGDRFVNADGSFAPANYTCDADQVGVPGDFDCAIFTGGGFCVDGGELVEPSTLYHGSILHHEGGHFLFGLPDEKDQTNGKLGCLSELERSASATCGGDGFVGEWSYGTEPLDILGGVTSVMSAGFRDQFCDPTTHMHQIHHDFSGDGGGAAVVRNENEEFELNPSMWEILREVVPGLDNDVHADGVFGTFGYDGLPDIDCVFHEDVLRNDPLIVLDRSFSMNLSNPIDPGYTALDAAKEAAANLYNLVPAGIYAGVTAYNTGFSVPVPYAPVDFGAPQQGKITVEEQLPFGPNNNTNIVQAITESAELVLAAQAESPGQLSGALILLSDGLPTDPPGLTAAEHREQILLAALEACAAGDPPIAIHTLAFGDADTELLHDIAGACDGMIKVNGGNRATAESPLDYKESLARMGYAARGRAEVLHQRQTLSSATQELPFFVPARSADLEFTWLGKPHDFLPGSGASSPPLSACDFDELTFELETPSGVVLPAAAVSPVGDLELGYGARTARQREPEAGLWTARVHAPRNCVATTPELVWLGNVRNGWYATSLRLSDEVAPRNTPVTVEAQMFYANVPLTQIYVLLQVLDKGQSQFLVPVDDGTGPDARAGDGIYTAEIPPLAGGQPAGGLTVNALYASTAGVSVPVAPPLDPFLDGVDVHATGTPALPGTALLLDEETLVRRACCVLPADSTVGCAETCRAGANLDQAAPRLGRGASHREVEVEVCGLPLLPHRVQAGAGSGVALRNLRSSYDPQSDCGVLTFDADVRPDAAIGPRRINVESNGRRLHGEGGLVVCDRNRSLTVAAEDVAVETCQRRASVLLPLPAVSSACGGREGAALTAELVRVGGEILSRPLPIAVGDPTVSLPPGTSEVVWRATDPYTRATARATQLVTVVARGSRLCRNHDQPARRSASDTRVDVRPR